MLILAIDDGHDKDTPGKRTPIYEDGHVIHENEFNRACAEFLRQAADRCGIIPVMCAPGDKDYSLKERVATANAAKADIFVSIHYNAGDDQWGGNRGGVETWHYRDSKMGPRLARCIQDELVKGTKQEDRGIKAGGFYVTRYTNMPAVLIECGFMDYRPEADLMLDESFQRETAEDICRGICAYSGTKYIAPDELLPGIDNIKAEIKSLAEKIIKIVT